MYHKRQDAWVERIGLGLSKAYELSSFVQALLQYDKKFYYVTNKMILFPIQNKLLQ